MTAADCLSGPGPLRLALTLVHFLWQGLAVAALTALAVRAMALRAGPPRYAAYLTALLALAACPVVTFLLVEPPVAPHTLPAEAAGLSDTADGLPASSASGPWQAVGGADVPAGQPSAPTGGPYLTRRSRRRWRRRPAQCRRHPRPRRRRKTPSGPGCCTPFPRPCRGSPPRGSPGCAL